MNALLVERRSDSYILVADLLGACSNVTAKVRALPPILRK